VTHATLADHEEKLLMCLLRFYREIGPGATPSIKGVLEYEGGLELHELDDAVRGLREKSLIQYWPLKPAVRLTAEGLRLAILIEGDGRG
jgi:hypothetical protein